MRSVGPAPARVRNIRLKMFKQPITNHQSRYTYPIPCLVHSKHTLYHVWCKVVTLLMTVFKFLPWWPVHN